MKILACCVIGFTAGCLIGYCTFRERPHYGGKTQMRAIVELRDRERRELKTDDL